MTLAVPELAPDCDTLTAALAYAAAGWYVGPLRAGTKHPGSVLGSRWQEATSRDPHVIAAWFAGSDDGVFLHVGRSGAVVLDVDDPDQLDWLRPLLTGPFQATRKRGERGHHVFAAPDGTSYGNGLGGLPRGWGEVRGRNGVIVAFPTRHVSDDGEYRWLTTGDVPLLPTAIADRLPTASGAGGDAATDSQVVMFLDSAITADAPEALRAVLSKADDERGDGKARHDACRDALCWAMDDAAAGLYAAKSAVDALRQWWTKAWAHSLPNERDTPDPGEFEGMLAWAVGQALTKTDAELTERRERVIRPVADTSLPDDSYSDQALAVRFLHEHDSRLRFVRDSQRWAVWNGCVWEGPNAPSRTIGEDQAAALLAGFLVVVGREAGEAARQRLLRAGRSDEEADAEAAKVRADFESRRRHSNTWSMVKVRAPSIVGITVDELDADPWLLNVANGILDLRTGTLSPHDPQAWQTMMTAAPYDPSATAPLWSKALIDAQPDPDVRAYLARRTGAALIGRQVDHVLHVDYGELGRNGKGIHLGAIKAALGDYAAIAPADVLLTAKDSKHPEELARLRGKRMVWVDELRQERGLDDARVKNLSGGSNRAVRFMHEGTWEYRPCDTWMLSTNRIPKFRGDDDALRTRLRIVPWDVSFAGREDTSLPLRIEADELAGVLAWMVQGCRAYQSDGLNPPLSVIAMTADTANSADPVGSWAADEVVAAPGNAIPVRDLYRRFKRVFEDEYPAERPPSMKAYTMALSGYLRRQSVRHEASKPVWIDGKTTRCFVGVALTPAAAAIGGWQ